MFLSSYIDVNQPGTNTHHSDRVLLTQDPATFDRVDFYANAKSNEVLADAKVRNIVYENCL